MPRSARLFTLVFVLLLAACGQQETATGPYAVTGPIEITDASEQRGRTLDVLYWYPEDLLADDQFKGTLPLAIFAHGLGGSPEEGSWLARHLASQGYIVAAVRFPQTNREVLEQMNMNDLLNQPGDVTRVVNISLSIVPGLPEVLQGRVNQHHIALVGHSFGGITAFLAGYDHYLHDPRLQAVVLLAAGGGDFLYERFYRTRELPMLLLHGTKDLLVDFETTSAVAFKRSSSPRILAKFVGGTHLGFGNGGILPFNYDELPCRMARDRLRDDGTVTFHRDLVERDADTGVGEFSAPLPCEFAVPDDPTMTIRRQQALSLELIVPFLDYAFARHDEEAEYMLAQHLDAVQQENDDIEISHVLFVERERY